MKRKDWILISVILIVGLLSYYFVNMSNQESTDAMKVIIKYQGKVIKEFPFDKNTVEKFELVENNEINTVEIKDGKVSITEANCNDLVCVKTGEISKPGEIIVCLPHKFSVEIFSDEYSNILDDIAE